MPRFRKRERREDVWINQLAPKDFTNPQLEEYYAAALPWEEGEWEKFLLTLRVPLPTCVRMTLCEGGHTERVRSLFEEAIATGEGGIRTVPMFAGSGKVEAWDIEVPRRQLRKHPVLRGFHQQLVMETDVGAISRQEAVSMVPVCFLDVQPHHSVLDMCAAPGSKTAQIIESMPDPTKGVVIANDVDIMRLRVLIRQCSRLRGFAPHLLVTHHCATAYPTHAQFDRILCDVMCSGDGTLRKSPDLWTRWKPNDGPNMHREQLKVLRRGIRLLKVGGTLVYSTCSMNPLEDEATVAACIVESKGMVEIVENHALPNMKYRPGMPTWKVMTNDGRWFSDFDSVPADIKAKFNWTPSMFPPKDVDLTALGIHHTMRILPHQQNTGGFFIAVLRKVGEVPLLPAETKYAPKTFTTYAPVDPKLREEIQRTFLLREDFPFHLLVQRTESKKQKMYFSCPDAHKLVSTTPQNYNFQHVGMRIFEFAKVTGDPIRLAQEACAFVAAYLPPGILLSVSGEEMKSFLLSPSTSGGVKLLEDTQARAVVITTTAADGNVIYVSIRKGKFFPGWSTELDPAEKNWILCRLGHVIELPKDKSDDESKDEEGGEGENDNEETA